MPTSAVLLPGATSSVQGLSRRLSRPDRTRGIAAVLTLTATVTGALAQYIP
ncbi:hypothetical protein ACFRKE_35850 [Kitasatospora indigofera]|uniref:hypothetical protein n=1 Tax=Kitasatospora indigofera TaxID=67307 RepID=UPI0036B50F31